MSRLELALRLRQGLRSTGSSAAAQLVLYARSAERSPTRIPTRIRIQIRLSLPASFGPKEPKQAWHIEVG